MAFTAVVNTDTVFIDDLDTITITPDDDAPTNLTTGTLLGGSTGGQLLNGELLEYPAGLQTPGSTRQPIRLVEGAPPTPPAPHTVYFEDTDTQADIATEIAAAVEVELGLTPGDILIFNDRVRLPDAEVAILVPSSRFALQTSEIEAINSATTVINRLEIELPGSFGLSNGSRLNVQLPDGSTSFVTFYTDETASPANPDPQDRRSNPDDFGVAVAFGETAEDLAQRFQTSLRFALGIPEHLHATDETVLLNASGTGVLLFADSAAIAGGFGVLDQPVTTQEIVLPAGSNLISGERLTINGFQSNGLLQNTVFSFVDIDNAPSGSPVNPIFYRATDSAEEIANLLLDAIRQQVPFNVVGLPPFEGFIATVADNVVSVQEATSVQFGEPILTDLQSRQTNGVYLSLPADPEDIEDPEQVIITLADGTSFTIQFEDIAFNVPDPDGTFSRVGTDVDPDDNLSPAQEREIIQQAVIEGLPLRARAIFVPSSSATDGQSVIQILNAVDIRVVDPEVDTLFVVGTSNYARTAERIEIANGDQLRNGEILEFLPPSGGTGSFRIRFEQVGANNLPIDPTVNLVVPFDETTIGTDLFAQIIEGLNERSPVFRPFIAFDGQAIHLDNADVTVNVIDPPPAVQETTRVINEVLDGGGLVNAILIDSTMDAETVAPIVATALAQALGVVNDPAGQSQATAEQYPILGGTRLRIYNALPIDLGSFGSSQFGLNSSPVDQFGETLPTSFARSQVDDQSAGENNVEGVYIDDIIVGFAERGEYVLNAPANLRDFVINPETRPDTRIPTDTTLYDDNPDDDDFQPERPSETLTGGYALEVRTSTEYGVSEDFNGLLLEGRLGFGRSFDTNDRLVDNAVTLIAQPGTSLIDGDTFVLDDGNSQLTFEFDSDNSVGVGNVPVAFDPISNEPIDTAAAIRDAINSPQSQTILDILAASGDSFEVGTSTSSGASEVTSDRVELFGDAITVNPGRGRFSKIDLVETETPFGRATTVEIPVVDHVNQTVTADLPDESSATAVVANYFNGDTDVLVATGKIGDSVTLGNNLAEQGLLALGDDPAADTDFVRIYLGAGQTVDIDVDTEGYSRAAPTERLNPLVDVLQNGIVVGTSMGNPSRAPGEFYDGAYVNFMAPSDGYYDIRIASADGSIGEYALTVRPEAATTTEIPDRDVVLVDYHFGSGDINRVKDQGQLIISSNVISNATNFGIFADRATTDPSGNAQFGTANLLRSVNNDRLVTGTVISNNLIFDSAGGILFSGGAAADGTRPDSVPFGRIVNNTVVGAETGNGIVVNDFASPTVLNNLISGFETGLSVDASSRGVGTVVAGNAFNNNATNSTLPLDSTSLVIDGDVFQDIERDIYIPAAGSPVIDSSFASLDERFLYFQTVKSPAGLGESPILAPLFDAFGIPRFDDPLVNPPGPSGGTTTIDRGAVDRADRTQPVAILTTPEDAIGTIVVQGDQDRDESFVRLQQGHR